MKFERKKKNEDKDIIINRNIQVKLPNLVLTKFESTHLDWFQFWNQFETEIDKVEIHAINKYSYLKEFIVTNVRALIDDLPLTSEVYTRPKSILLAKFGKPSGVAAAHIQWITSLPVVSNSNPNKILEFYEKLVVSMQAFDKNWWANWEILKVYVRLTLHKLPGIRYDLVRLDDEWQGCDFPRLVESLRKWTDHNPETLHSSEKHEKCKSENVYQIKEQESKNRESNPNPRVCIYCEKSGHKVCECESVSSIKERRLILPKKKLCFNCTGGQHSASECCSNKRVLVVKVNIIPRFVMKKLMDY